MSEGWQVPAKTPRAGAQELPVTPPQGVKFVADALADNLRAYRLLSQLEQNDVAERMQRLGHPWRRVTVSEVERGRRNVTVPELLALALLLGTTVQELLDPRRPDQRAGSDMMTFLMLTPDAKAVPLPARHLASLMCRHEFDVQPADFPADGVVGFLFRQVQHEGGEQP
jgi:transcriptional regulator with XRE-family HTH domain